MNIRARHIVSGVTANIDDSIVTHPVLGKYLEADDSEPENECPECRLIVPANDNEGLDTLTDGE